MHNFWKKLPKPIIALAPMAGYSDSAFRQICREFGADVVYSEMISVDGICYDNQKTMRLLWHDKSEYPLVFQLFGNSPQKFAQAVKIINKKFKNKKNIGLDLNLGCPAHKIIKTGAGASLMDEKEKAYQIIKAVCDNTDLPVSIKIRTTVKNTLAEEFINKVKGLPWTTVMIHGRTLNQGFAGEIDSVAIRKVKKLLPDKIVLANGGITDSQSAIRLLKKTGADGLGIARGALGNPWLFSQIKSLPLAKGEMPPILHRGQRGSIMLRHAGLFLKNNDNLIPLRKHLVHYVKSQKNASELRQKLIKVETLAELNKIILEISSLLPSATATIR
ncbi:hypothetical protein COW86_01335 [Candidatus Kuenenbacteria bacterium CG22_combo_CG10-13_8_21_14_all_39_9]|uniref:tRNA-dihydrouridine synthase n=1 Tax=Candidatus Kuenenbacteria bacterium CG22_combo_CG10-13_8_21_14_all_39_9 TaxID=1974621 RepID=A0A2H0D2M2_9BACT|nr:MAG: hypothetical protein COW86_01335 [Candidatus Kuenenbacteria bacterium CG22_combo_CG10-13_8_21_14_all_39_9]